MVPWGLWEIPADKHLQSGLLSGYKSRMSALPDWLEPNQHLTGLPDWLSGAPVERVRRSDVLPVNPEGKARLFAEFEMVFPRILEMMAGGYTMKRAVRELPIEIDSGALMRWLKKNPKYNELYKEAKELRTEAWADEIIRHAEGKDEDGNETLADTARSRLIVDTYWKLMGADNRKQYGDTKTIEVNQNISITAALAQAQGRVIEAQLIEDDEVDLLPSAQYKQLTSGEDEDDDA